jgi:hypothetical protein
MSARSSRPCSPLCACVCSWATATVMVMVSAMVTAAAAAATVMVQLSTSPAIPGLRKAAYDPGHERAAAPNPSPLLAAQTLSLPFSLSLSRPPSVAVPVFDVRLDEETKKCMHGLQLQAPTLGPPSPLPPPPPPPPDTRTAPNTMNDFERFGRNVVRTFYDPLPANDSNEPIWLLGERYDSRPPLPKPTPSDTPSAHSAAPQAERTEDESWIRTSLDEKERKESPNGEDPTQYGNWPSAFLDDFESRVWMTYRSGFAPIQKSQDPKATSAMSFRVRMQNLASPGFTSDAGFGCMIRSAQCILANALQILRLGRAWRWQDHEAQKEHAEILSLFADDPQAPFSIHRFVEHGAAVCGKYPGEWFGPSAAARCIQDLVNKYREAGLKVYVSGDGADVYEDKLKQIAVDDYGQWQPTLILVGTRLGIDKITPVYWEALKASLQIPQSIGVAG